MPNVREHVLCRSACESQGLVNYKASTSVPVWQTSVQVCCGVSFVLIGRFHRSKSMVALLRLYIVLFGIRLPNLRYTRLRHTAITSRRSSHHRPLAASPWHVGLFRRVHYPHVPFVGDSDVICLRRYYLVSVPHFNWRRLRRRLRAHVVKKIRKCLHRCRHIFKSKILVWFNRFSSSPHLHLPLYDEGDSPWNVWMASSNYTFNCKLRPGSYEWAH